jgi:hypothetical protein
MVEVLIAVLVLGLVVTASLKLVMLSERGLSQVRVKEALLDDANRYLIELTIDPTNTFGMSGDVSWNVEDMKVNPFIDGTLDLQGLNLFSEENNISIDMDKLKEREYRWRELEITKKGESIKLFLPYSDVAEGSSGDIMQSPDIR